MEPLLIKRLTALSHPQRMAVFRLLVRRYPDALPAGEIGTVLDLKPSTTSVYLAALNDCGLISQERQGTSLRYALDGEGARAVVSDLFLDCCKGRPDLCPPSLRDVVVGPGSKSDGKYNVLFICTGNSARSIFAETIMRDVAGDMFNVFSAGTNPYSKLNPTALDILESNGLDTRQLRAKNISEFQRQDAPRMDFVFTVCDQAANEECPAWTDRPISAHWGLPDPVKAEGTDAEKRLAFQHVFGALQNRIKAFASLPIASLTDASLQIHIDQIAQFKE